MGVEIFAVLKFRSNEIRILVGFLLFVSRTWVRNGVCRLGRFLRNELDLYPESKFGGNFVVRNDDLS